MARAILVTTHADCLHGVSLGNLLAHGAELKIELPVQLVPVIVYVTKKIHCVKSVSPTAV